MNHALSLIEHTARALANTSWQSAVLIVLVAAATWCLRRSRPMVRYVLWSVVLVRLCLPFGFTSPLGVGGAARALHRSSTPVSGRDAPVTAAEFGPSESISATMGPRRSDANSTSAQEHAVAAAIIPPAATRLSVWAWCGIVWITGAVFLAAFVLRRWSLLRGVIVASEACRRPELVALLDELRGRFGIASRVGLKCLPASAD